MPAADPGPPVEGRPELEVQTSVVRREPWEQVVRLPAELEAYEEVTLSAEVPGRLEELSVDLGARVSAGQALARIDTRQYALLVEQAEAALLSAAARLGLPSAEVPEGFDPDSTALVREARAALDLARLDYQRLQGLVDSGVSSRAEVDHARAALDGAEGRWQTAREEVHSRLAMLAQRRAEVALARRDLDNAAVVAPFEGSVAERLAAAGDHLAVGAPVIRLVRDHPLRLVMHVPERQAPMVRAGQAVRARLEDGLALAGTITRTAPAIAAGNRTLRIEADIDNSPLTLRPGAFARGEIVVAPRADALVVPEAALVRFAGIDKVFVLEEGRAREVRVRVGRIEGQRVEVLEGVEAGARLVLSPGRLQDGAPVRAAQP